jgi:hypothetical protein
MVQTTIPPFCTTIEPVGAPVVPDVTVAVRDTEFSSSDGDEEGVTLSVVVVVAGNTKSEEVVEVAVKFASPGYVAISV